MFSFRTFYSKTADVVYETFFVFQQSSPVFITDENASKNSKVYELNYCLSCSTLVRFARI